MTKKIHQENGGLHAGNGHWLAVIDDDDRWLKVFSRMFRNSGYHLETFSNPHDFLRLVHHEPGRFSGIICDIKMPEIDGHQIFRSIKKDPSTANIPFVMVSGALTENHNLSKVQGLAYVSKLDDDVCSRIFDELIEVIENWPHIQVHLRSQQATDDDIEFFYQFYVNFHLFFSKILNYVSQMEASCVNSNLKEAEQTRRMCDQYIGNLNQRIMDLIEIVQECPHAQHFIANVCRRARTCLNMILHFQLLIGEAAPADSDFPLMLTECRENLEKIIVGNEKGYNLRE